MTDCPPEYTNLGEESFGDEKVVTSHILRTSCRNQAYLKQEVDSLRDSTDPELRKRFAPIIVEDDFSYGMTLDGATNKWKFNDSTSFGPYTESFTSIDRIDLVNTTAMVDLTNGRCQLPGSVGTKVENAKCEGPWTKYACNTSWNVGWNRTSNYWVTPDSLDNKFTASIPSVARCNVFKATATGYITELTLAVHGSPHAEDDLYVEIRDVNQSTLVPSSSVLTREKVDTTRFTSLSLLSIPVKGRVKVTSGSYYAIIVRSPLTTYQNHFGLGGWGRNCGDVCTDSTAFTSYDNCATWVKHGRDDASVPYSEGYYAPVDFAFNVKTTPITDTFSTGTTYYVYLKPVTTNPITSVTLTADSTNTTLTYWVSPNMVDWYEVNSGNSWTKTFSAPKPTKLYVRVNMSTASSGTTPYLNQIVLNFVWEKATVGYVRSKFYFPRTSMPMGASIWSSINAPYTAESNTTVSVEIIRGSIRRDLLTANGSSKTFTLSKLPAEPLAYCILNKTSDNSAVEYTEGKDYVVDYDTGVLTFHAANPAPAAGQMKVDYYPIWLKGLDATDFPLKTDFFQETFTATASQTVFNLMVEPCDPMRTVSVNGTVKTEDDHFSVDYSAKQLVFKTGLTAGDVVVIEYTPFLPDTGLALAYRTTRSNTNYQAYLDPSYYQYRV